jgi:hypothetical protein
MVAGPSPADAPAMAHSLFFFMLRRQMDRLMDRRTKVTAGEARLYRISKGGYMKIKGGYICATNLASYGKNSGIIL